MKYCKKWIDLDGEQSIIAANIAGRIKRWSLHSETELVEDEIASEIANMQYQCYIRFCDKTKIERAEKRIMKQKAVAVDASNKGEANTPVAPGQHLNMCVYHHEH